MKLLVLILCFSSFIANAYKAGNIHCDTKLEEISYNDHFDDFNHWGHQNIFLATTRLATDFSEILTTDDMLNLIESPSGELLHNGKYVYSSLPFFPAEVEEHTFHLFENVRLPGEAFNAGDYIALTKSTVGSGDDATYYISAVAYRNHQPIIYTNINVDKESNYDSTFALTPNYAHHSVWYEKVRSKIYSQYQAKEINYKEFEEQLYLIDKKLYESLGQQKYTALWLNCTLYK